MARTSDSLPRSRRFIVSACGRGGHGKTHFACTAPRPLHYLSIDPSTLDAFEQMSLEPGRESGITLVEFKKPIPSFWGETKRVQEDADEQWKRFLEVNEDILSSKAPPATVVWDTATEFYEIAVLAELGRTEQLMYYQRAIPNRIFSRVLDAYQSSAINLVLLHRLKERWVEEEKKVRSRGGGTSTQTERVRDTAQPYEREGFKKIEYVLQAEVFLMKRDADPDDEELANRFGMKVMKCTRQPSLEGSEWWGKTKKGRDRVSWDWLYEAVFA